MTRARPKIDRVDEIRDGVGQADFLCSVVYCQLGYVRWMQDQNERKQDQREGIRDPLLVQVDFW